MRLGEGSHKSKIIVTSRERIIDVFPSIRNLTLSGLSYPAAQKVLEEESLPESASTKALINQYRGNPLILRIIALDIHDLFDSDMAHFLKQKQTLFGNIEYLIAQQCDRLSPEEKEILKQLTQKAEPIPIDQFEQAYSLQALSALTRRSLIEKSDAGFTLRPVVMEYVRRYML